MRKKETKKQHTPSAYDDFLRSGELDTMESNIDYFSEKPQSKRTATARSRSTGAQKTGTHKTGAHKTGGKKRKSSIARLSAKIKREHSPSSAQNHSAEYLERKVQKEHARKQKPYKNDNFVTLISAAIITLLLFFFSILTLTGSVKPYSDQENRYLAGRPKLSASSLADGKYMEDMESYLSDQFAGRSALVKTRTAIDVLCGKKEINNVYIGKNHFLFEKPTAYDPATVQPTLEAINTFTLTHKKLNSYLAIAPNASSILAELMPKNAPLNDRGEELNALYSKLDENLQVIDIYTPLEDYEEKKELYYRTDHHWTTRAAEIAFNQIAAGMELDTSQTPLQTYAVTNDFQGTLATSSGLFNAKDTIEIPVPETDVQYVVTNMSENEKTSSVFVSSKLEEQNKYEVFFGGNYSQINIDTTLNSKQVLMVVKDSYANCLLPMLIPYYKRIVIIDPRYYTDDIEKTITNEGVTDVLWLYNADTFLADTSIQTVFR